MTPNPIAIRFGKNLARERAEANVSQEALAVLAGLHRTEIGLLERGERCPRIDTVVKLAAALNVPVDALIRGITWNPGSVQPGGFGFSPSSDSSTQGPDAMAEGIRKRHSKSCPARNGGRCRCDGGYEASVYSPRDGKKIYRTFQRESEAKSWRADAKRSLDHGKLRAPNGRTLREVAESWLNGVERGEIRNRSGRPFKPSTLRGYRLALAERILPEIGSRKLTMIMTADLQALVDRWQAEGHAPSTVRNSIKPLQAIYRRARAREGLPVNPTHDLELPTPNPTEVEIVAPKVAARLLAALPVNDRAVWATALYAGLRYGELRALRWGAVYMSRGVIEVRESWDPKEGPISPKTRKSRRTVPMPKVLREQLLAKEAQPGNSRKRALVFGAAADEPFQAERLYRHAAHYWHRAGLRERLRLHQARHTYASFMIAAGVNAKALAAFMGHSSITVTFDLYGHLMPDSEAEGAALLDAFLDSQD